MISSKLKISKRIAAVLLALFFAIGCSACKKTDNNQKSVVEPGAVIARIGDQTINYALFNAAFESYAEYMEQMGYSPYNSRSDLESFQNLVLDALVADMVTLYHANSDGFTIPEEMIAEVEEDAKKDLADIRTQYMSLAETAHEQDPALSVEEHFNKLIGELAVYYTGETLTFEQYSADYTRELINSRLIEEYKNKVCSEFTVTDAEVSEWYNSQLEFDEEQYQKTPEEFKIDMDYYERYGTTLEDSYPPTYVPEGYARIMDIIIKPDGELNEEYFSKLDELDSIAGECSALLFNDELNGNDANAERIAELLENYRVLKAETDEMYASYTAEARAAAEEACALLEAGTPFAEVMLRYTQDPLVIGSDTRTPVDIYRTKGQIISTQYTSLNDWSTTVKDIFGMTPEGEYSAVFTDTDGSLHIIYHGESLKAGAVPVDDIRSDIEFFVRSEKSEADWNELIDAWKDDRDLIIDYETVRSVGVDKLPVSEQTTQGKD